MPADPVITPLGPATTAYVQLPGGWFLNNAGWITGRERSLLVDTCATEARSHHLLESARTANPGAEITAVLTHAHGDHANGAGLLTHTGGTVLTSPAARADILTGPHTYPSLFDCTSWGDITPPDDTEVITETTTLDLGETTAEIHPVPTHAHTTGDLVVWHPGDRVLFTGDLLFHDVTPLGMHGSITGWLDALDWLDTFEAAQLVPGHGWLVASQDGAITALRDYFHWLLDAATTDQPDFDTLEQHARSHWPGWHDPERHAVNLRIAHAETHHYQPDPTTTFEAMLHSAGGPIPLHI